MDEQYMVGFVAVCNAAIDQNGTWGGCAVQSAAVRNTNNHRRQENTK